MCIALYLFFFHIVSNACVFNACFLYVLFRVQCACVNAILSDFFSLFFFHSYQQCTLLFEEHERQFQRIRNLGVPPAPKTIDDIVKQFDRPDILDVFGKSKHEDGREMFLDYIHKGSHFNYMIFSSKRIIKYIKINILVKDRKYHIDGTFYIVPYGCFKQYLMFHLEKFDTVHPFIYVLMDVRTAEAYTHVFKYINENIFNLECASFTSDYERALRNALRHVIPMAILIPCWFHHKQAVRKKASQLPIFFHLIRTDESAAHLYQKFQALALLPPDMIIDAFNALKEVAISTYGHKFKPFVDYFERQWIESVSVSLFCIYIFKCFHKIDHTFFSHIIIAI